jgi:hypothetical protein
LNDIYFPDKSEDGAVQQLCHARVALKQEGEDPLHNSIGLTSIIGRSPSVTDRQSSRHTSQQKSVREEEISYEKRKRLPAWILRMRSRMSFPNQTKTLCWVTCHLGATCSLSVSHYSDPAIRNPTWKDLRRQEEVKYSRR